MTTYPVADSPKTLDTEQMEDDAVVIERVRELLFGEKMREYDQRLAQLESQFEQRQTSMHEELQIQIQATSQHLSSAFNQLQAVHQQLDERLKQDIETLGLNAEKDFQQLQQQLDALHTDLQQLTIQESKDIQHTRHLLQTSIKNMLQKLDQYRLQMHKQIQVEINRLNNDKVNRDELASMFRQWLTRLSDISPPVVHQKD